ncbi:bifunctional diguanylate cyclase/phosphodiesterase [Pseudomonas jessenii]|uniref:sensor domain-containing protein n=1 Tax=Pseudomonas jessenii TaxID=77298 RepID=UPI003891F843
MFAGHMTKKSAVFIKDAWSVACFFSMCVVIFIPYMRGESQVRSANELRAQAVLLSDQYLQLTDDLTRSARSYVMTGRPDYKQFYKSRLDIRDNKEGRLLSYSEANWQKLILDDDRLFVSGGQLPVLIELMEHSDVTSVELAKLGEIKFNSEVLSSIESSAMALIDSTTPVSRANRGRAIGMLHDRNYESAKHNILRLTREFQQLLDWHMIQVIYAAEKTVSIVRTIFVLVGCLFLFIRWRSRKAVGIKLGGSVDSLQSCVMELRNGSFVLGTPDIKENDSSGLAGLLAQEARLAQATHDLKIAQDQLKTIFDTAVVGIVFIKDRQITRSNFKFDDMFGYARGALIGSSTRIFYSDDVSHDVDTAGVLVQFSKSEIISRETPMLRRDGSQFICRIFGRAIDANDQERETVWMVEEVTERHEAEKEMRLARVAAESANGELAEVLRFNEAVLLNSPLPIVVCESGGRMVKANEAYIQLFSATIEDVLAQNFHHVSAWKTSGLLDDCLLALSSNSAQRREVSITTSSGKEIITDCRILPTQLNGEIHLLIQFIDLTELKNVNEMLENILHSMSEGVHVIDVSGTIILENEASKMMFRWQGDELLGLPAHETVHHHHGDGTDFHVNDCAIWASLRDGQVRYVENDLFWSKNGTCFPVEYTASPILNRQGRVHAITVVFRDITDRKRLEDELRALASHDALTGLANRRLLLEQMTQAISFGKRHNSHAAVLFLDLNKFKVVNDTYGHETGDQLLIEVAKRLKRIVRETDTVARLGGDEFVILLGGVGAEFDQASDYVVSVTEKVHHALSEECVLGGIRHFGSTSIGVRLFIGESDAGNILKDADAAMYQSKRSAQETPNHLALVPDQP